MAIDTTFITGSILSIEEKKVLLQLVAALQTGQPSTTATSAELNTLAGAPASVTTAATPGTGTNAVQFTFKDAQGAALTKSFAGTAYFSNAAGTAIAAATSGATLTNGVWQDNSAGKTAEYVTSATGLLGCTVTGATGTYYISFVLPSGAIVTSSAIICN